MTTAFVLSGGASLGASQVGMLAAFAEAGIQPDLIVGTSVGAVNGGWIAGRPGPAGTAALADLWRSLKRADVFPTRPLTGLLGFLGRQSHLVPDSGLRRLLEEHLTFRRLEDAPIPFYVVATDVLSGEDVLLSHGDAVEAILASAAIPAVFPPVRVEGRDLIDGGVVNNTPISHAVALGADIVWVLSTGYACALPSAPQGALAMALHSLTLVVNQRLAIDVERYETAVDLRVVPPLCPIRSRRRTSASRAAHRPCPPGDHRVARVATPPHRPSGPARAASAPPARRRQLRGPRVALRPPGRRSSDGKAMTTRRVPIAMLRATWHGAVLAEADRTVVVEGNHYFPPDTVNFELLRPRRTRSLCFWKGVARYYDAVVDGEVNRAAAWSYRHPSPLARKIRGHVAFWNGVRVEGVE